jgi:hypothetical protein
VQGKGLSGGRVTKILSGMAETTPEKNPEKTRRDERLAAALRENLRRRKAQARGREQSKSRQAPEPSSEDEG